MIQEITLPPLPEWADRTLQGEDRDSLFAWAEAAIEADRKRQGDAAKVLAELVALIPLADTLNASASCQDLIDYFKGLIADRERRGEPSGYAYRYRHYDGETVIRFNDGCEVNGSRPIDTLPYWFAPQPAEPVNHSVQDCPEDDKWNCKYCKRVNNCPVQGHRDAQPDEPVATIRHFHYQGIARSGLAQEPVMLDGAPTLPDGTMLYAVPQPAEPVSGGPVAWRTYDRNGWYVISPTLEEAERDFPGKRHQPLYAAPQPAAPAEAPNLQPTPSSAINYKELFEQLADRFEAQAKKLEEAQEKCRTLGARVDKLQEHRLQIVQILCQSYS